MSLDTLLFVSLQQGDIASQLTPFRALGGFFASDASPTVDFFGDVLSQAVSRCAVLSSGVMQGRLSILLCVKWSLSYLSSGLRGFGNDRWPGLVNDLSGLRIKGS